MNLNPKFSSSMGSHMICTLGSMLTSLAIVVLVVEVEVVEVVVEVVGIKTGSSPIVTIVSSEVSELTRSSMTSLFEQAVRINIINNPL